MRLRRDRHVLVVFMPLFDLFVLCLQPEFRQVLGRFPSQAKAHLLANPPQLFLCATVAPFIMATRGPNPVLERLRKTLRATSATQLTSS